MTSSHPDYQACLEVDQISKRFGVHTALDRISFSTRSREILGLIGPNGAGKSTLLECITGLTHADHGRVLWRNRPLARGERSRILWYQPDGILPYPGQRVGLTLSFFRRLNGMARETLDTLIARLDLEPVLGKPLQALSKGFQRRTLLALALLSRQPVLLLDEPFDGFDVRQSLAMMTLLRHWCRKRTLILSIHQLSEAEKICDRFLLLDQGRLLAKGTLAQLRNQGRLAPSASLEEVFLALT